MTIGKGQSGQHLSVDDIRGVVTEALGQEGLDGKRVLFIIPDSTRTCPIPAMFRIFHEVLNGKAAAIDYLVALGTHMPMDDEALNKLVGITAEERAGKYANVNLFNHEWDKPESFKNVGTITNQEIRELSNGLMDLSVEVALNKLVFDYDQVIVCGPVFPHEVAGFSGGNKYFFPGISGSDVINMTHWLGALITNYEVIGTKYTPIRAVIDKAASLVNVNKSCFCMVVKGTELSGLYYGSPEDAWAAASELSSQEHVIYVEKPYKQILSVMPKMYDDVWTAGKGMYKMEPVCADGGEVIIYAPHIDEISYTHGKVIDEVGYHVRDYFAKQWDKFKHQPWGVLAHSTHVRGMGTFEDGVEKPRVQVTLATQIPEERCKKVNLGYRDPATINPADFEGKEAEGILMVPKAGEMLYRVKK